MATGYEYKVVELREGLLGGKMSSDKLEKILNEHAGKGWQLKAITAVEVKGRIGPGGVDGVLVTFERPRS
jgi:predicted ABC-type sugar transport system permease subunit